MISTFAAHLDRKSTTIGVAVLAGDATITLTNAGVFGSTYPYYLLIWNASLYANPANDPSCEVVKITATAGNIITVTRGVRETTAHAHSIGDSAVMAFMADDLNDIQAAVVALQTGITITLTGTITDLPNAPTVPGELVVPMSAAISTATGAASSSWASYMVQSVAYLINGSPPASGSISWRECLGTNCAQNLYLEVTNYTEADAPSVTYTIVVRGLPA